MNPSNEVAQFLKRRYNSTIDEVLLLDNKIEEGDPSILTIQPKRNPSLISMGGDEHSEKMTKMAIEMLLERGEQPLTLANLFEQKWNRVSFRVILFGMDGDQYGQYSFSLFSKKKLGEFLRSKREQSIKLKSEELITSLSNPKLLYQVYLKRQEILKRNEQYSTESFEDFARLVQEVKMHRPISFGLGEFTERIIEGQYLHFKLSHFYPELWFCSFHYSIPEFYWSKKMRSWLNQVELGPVFQSIFLEKRESMNGQLTRIPLDLFNYPSYEAFGATSVVYPPELLIQLHSELKRFKQVPGEIKNEFDEFSSLVAYGAQEDYYFIRYINHPAAEL